MFADKTTKDRGLEMYRERLNTRLNVGLDARIKGTSGAYSASKYINAFGGLVIAIALLIPVTWLPGLALLVLPPELYLIDWIYSQLRPNDKISYCDFSKKESTISPRAARKYTPSTWGSFSHFSR